MTEFSVNSGKGKDFTREQGRSLEKSRSSGQRWDQGERVLSRWSDGLLYIGQILEVDNINQRCLIRYEDLSVYWIMFKDIQKESFEHSDIICCVCNSGVSEAPNEIVICDHCNAGYHQNCHIPQISETTLQLDDEWNCRQCVFASTARKGGASNTGSTAKIMQNFKQKLPYDLKSLTWDSQHKRNLQQTYCYCGGPGSWLMKMLQCCLCLQWFHEACIQCLEKPLFLGDRFYVFLCSACNSGPEFIQRQNLTWLELVHLILFNLSMVEKKTYWDTEKIVNYVHIYWDDLQMNKDIKDAPSRDEIRKNVIVTLENNRTKFKCGRETKKKACLWGLRCRTPPSCVPAISCSKELLAKKLSLINKTLKTEDPSSTSPRRLRSKSNEIDIELPTPPPEESSMSECSVKKLKHRLKSALEPSQQTKGAVAANKRDNSEQITSPRKLAKKSTSKRCQKRKREPRRPLRSSSRSRFRLNSGVSTSCDDDSSSHGTLNSIIPPPKNFDGQNNPFLNVATYQQTFRSTNHNRSKKRNTRQTNNNNNKDVGKARSNHQKNEPRNVIAQNNNVNLEKSSFSLICDPFSECHQSMSVTKAFYPAFNHDTVQKSVTLSYNNLKSSVNNYFGAASRIANGEKFKVLASRMTATGKVQYLIEWEGINS